MRDLAGTIRRLLASSLVLLVLLLFTVLPSAAQVDCSDPDNLCTGDPCIIPAVEVASPCVADFGTRTLIIDGPLRIDTFGGLDLSAGAIEVLRGGIRTSTGEMSLSNSTRLAATTDIVVAGSISRNGRSHVMLVAGGNVEIRYRQTFLELYADAAGVVTIDRPIQAAIITLVGDQAVALEAGKLRMPDPLASLYVASPAGSVTVDARIQVVGEDVTIEAAGDITVNRRIDTRVGAGIGNHISLASSGGSIVVNARLAAQFSPGMVSITSAGPVVLNGSIMARGNDVHVEGAAVQMGPAATITVDGAPAGDVRLEATGGDLVLNGTCLARGGGGPGGVIEGMASGDIVATGSFACSGTPDGCIALIAGGSLDTTGASFDKPLSPDCPG